MKRIALIVFVLMVVAQVVSALTTGIVPCVEIDGDLQCFEEKYIPLINLTPVRQPIEIPAEEVGKAFDSCQTKDCHEGSPENKFLFANFDTEETDGYRDKGHKKHKKFVCLVCHEEVN